MVKTLTHPLVVSALVCAALVYAGAVQIAPRSPFYSLFAQKSIVRLDGMLISNPSKTARGTYRADISVTAGKIYTAAKNSALCETGAYLSLAVQPSFAAGEFAVTDVRALGWGSGIRGKLRHARALCRLQFKRLLYAWGNAGGLLLALLSGSREYTEGAVSEAFKNAGLSHILALSGMHLSLVSGLALVLGKRAAGRRFASALQLGAIVFFVWFAGISPSLFRALVCALIPFTCALLQLRRPNVIIVLCASFLLHLMMFPSHVQSAAFMLSYGALAGILTLGEPIRRLLCAHLFPALSDALGDSCAAQAFCPWALSHRWSSLRSSRTFCTRAWQASSSASRSLFFPPRLVVY